MMYRLLVIASCLFLLISCNGNENNDGSTIPPRPAPATIGFRIDTLLPHDTSAYTQGLQFYKGKLYEGTGDYKNSSLRIVDIATGKPEKMHNMGSDDIFGEGITILNDTIYQLTWQSNLVYLYKISDISKPVKMLKWPHEGWGITNDGINLIISDGTPNLYFVSPKDFKLLKTISVTDNNGNIDNVNELEYVDGFIYGNVYQTDIIIKIDPTNGHVVGKLSFPNLIQQYAPKEVTNRTDYFNGIAYDSATKNFYVTGKRWPRMFRFSLK